MDVGLVETIAARAAQAERLLVLLDFDGTLAPIVPHPDQARMGDAAREALQQLAASPRAAVGIVSARALDDVRARVGLPGLIYAGNHGWEIEGRGLSRADAPPPLGPLLAELRERLAEFDGVWIEDKRLTATVHMRQAKPEARASARRHVDEIVCASPEHRWRDAVEAIEVIPCGDWNKGSAALWVRRELGWDDALSFYAGDDTSDEDAFEAFADGVTIKVGKGPTKARYTAASPEELWGVLTDLARRT